MANSLWAMTVLMALGADPYGCPTCQPGGMAGGWSTGAPMMSYPATGSYYTDGFQGGYGGGGYSGGGAIYTTGMGLKPYSGSNGDTLIPWDSQEAWMHGYFQEISPYSGYHFYRPYNYKHVFAQADLAYRWGQPQGMPYSQQWWHKYHDRAVMHPQSHAQQVSQATAYQIEMARLQAWHDFQAQQQRLTPASAQAPAAYGQPATQAGPYLGEGAPTSPSRPNIPAVESAPSYTIPRSTQAPVIPEFRPSSYPNRR